MLHLRLVQRTRNSIPVPSWSHNARRCTSMDREGVHEQRAHSCNKLNPLLVLPQCRLASVVHYVPPCSDFHHVCPRLESRGLAWCVYSCPLESRMLPEQASEPAGRGWSQPVSSGRTSAPVSDDAGREVGLMEEPALLTGRRGPDPRGGLHCLLNHSLLSFLPESSRLSPSGRPGQFEADLGQLWLPISISGPRTSGSWAVFHCP